MSLAGTRAEGYEGHRHTVAKAWGGLYIAAAVIASARIMLLGGASTQVMWALVIAAFGLPAGAAIYILPFHRWPLWAYLGVSLLTAAHLALFMFYTGGSQSLFWPFAVFLALSAAAYFRDVRYVALVIAACVASVASPAIYEGTQGTFFRELFIRALLLVASGVLGRWLFQSLEENSVRALKQREEFLLNMAHVLRTPLTSLRASLDLMGQREPELVKSPPFTLAIRAEERMEAVLSRLMEYSRIREGTLTINVSPIPLKATVDAAVASLSRDAIQRDLKWDLQVPADLPAVLADPVRIRTAFTYVLENAVDHSSAGDEVTVRLTRRGSMVIVTVMDSGPGIPPEDRARLFEPDYRLNASENHADRLTGRFGTGVSLAIAAGIVRLHGGEIWEEGTVGKGAVVCFSLPIASGSAARA